MHGRKRKRGELKTAVKESLVSAQKHGEQNTKEDLVTAFQKSATSPCVKQDSLNSTFYSQDIEIKQKLVDTGAAVSESRLVLPLLGTPSDDKSPVMSPVSAMLGKRKTSFDFDISTTQVSMSPPLLLLSEDTLSSVTSQLANHKDPDNITEAGATSSHCRQSISQVRVDSPLLLTSLTHQSPVSHSIFDEYPVLPDETAVDCGVQEGLAVSNGCLNADLFPGDLVGTIDDPAIMSDCTRTGQGFAHLPSDTFGSTHRNSIQASDDHTKSVKCPQCRRCFASSTEKDAHISEKHNSIACLTCGAQVIGLKNYMSHMETHMQHSNSRCECCLATFLHPYSLLKHLEKIHWNSVKGLCEICGYKNRTKGKHFETHMPKPAAKFTPVPKVPNSVTPSSSQSSQNETKKSALVNSPEDIDVKISIASSSDTRNLTAAAVKPPKATDTNGEPADKISICLYCSKCDDVFTTESQWRRHQMYMHSDFKCVTCAETVCGFAAYQVHVSKHVNPNLPGQVCQEPSVLQKHIVKESQAADTTLSKGSFKCSSCGLLCANVAEYSSHMSVHLEASEYQCQDCGRRFLHQSSLQAHVRLKCNSSQSRKAQ